MRKDRVQGLEDNTKWSCDVAMGQKVEPFTGPRINSCPLKIERSHSLLGNRPIYTQLLDLCLSGDIKKFVCFVFNKLKWPY